MVLSKQIKAFIRLAPATLVLLGGCSSNPTNEPTAEAIADADAARAAAIDNNPNYSAEQKKAMKDRMGLSGAAAPGGR